MAQPPFLRIKGSNSDYAYSMEKGQVTPVEGADPLFLQIYICPHGMPGPVDQVDPEKLKKEMPYLLDGDKVKLCQGSDVGWGTGADARSACPHDGPVAGHALVSLHQTEGLKLVTNNRNMIALDQAGNIQIAPAKKAEVVGALSVKGTAEWLEDVKVNGRFTATAPVTIQNSLSVTGDLTIRPTSNIQMEVTTERVAIQAHGAFIIIDNSGDIRLTPRTGNKVTVAGNLEVTGTLTNTAISTLQTQLAQLQPTPK